MLICGPRHLRVILDEYIAHYKQHRPYRARNLRPPDSAEGVPAPITDLTTAKLGRQRVLDGLINEYGQTA